MGNMYARAVSKGLKLMNHEVVKLSDNRLTQDGTMLLIKRLKTTIKHLDLSHNIVGGPPAKELGEFMKYKAVRYIL